MVIPKTLQKARYARYLVVGLESNEFVVVRHGIDHAPRGCDLPCAYVTASWTCLSQCKVNTDSMLGWVDFFTVSPKYITSARIIVACYSLHY